MPSKASRAKPRTHREANRADLSYRTATLRPTADPAAPVPAILATEQPVRTYDKTHRKVVNEVLLMSGVELPKQVTLVDSHEDDDAKNAVGSLRSLAVNGDELHVQTHFSRRARAQELRDDVLDGHITDLSVGAERLEETFIDTGDEKTVAGRRFKGPARIVTRWRPFHGALVSRGADSRSVFTPRAYSDPDSLHEEHMTATLRTHAESLGMPKETADDAIATWISENTARKGAADPKATKPDTATERGAAVESKDADALKLEAATTERKRISTIRDTVREAGLDDAFATKLVDNGTTTERAAQAILAELSARAKAHGRGGEITPTGSEADTFRKAALDGLSLRFGQTVEKPAQGAADVRGMRFLDVAREALKVEGVTVRGMSDRDVISRAFGITSTLRASDGQAYLHTGNFSNLLLDAQNIRLQKAYMDVPSTFQLWARQAESAPDFKTIHVTKLGEVGNQPTVEENGDYKDMTLTDDKESYFVEKRGSLLSLTFEAMKNDRLDGFSRNVQLQGAAMRRTINRSIYQIFFDNATMNDGVALFHTSSHGANKVTSDLSVSVLNTAYAAMALQTGLNSDVILGIVPRYLVVAPGIWGDAAQLLKSESDPVAGGSTSAGNSNTHNVYGPKGQRQLTLIEEPILAANDADSWYLIADYNQVDTVEYCFLAGEETPVFEQETAFVQDAVKYKIRQTWGRKAIDYRGLYQSLGTG